MGAGADVLLRELRPARWTVVAYALLLVMGAVFLFVPGSILFTRILLVVAPLGAVAAALRTARDLPRGAATEWVLITLAASVAALTQALLLGRPENAWHPIIGVTFATVFIILLCALTLILHGRERERTAEIVLDGALLATAVSVVVLHWAPSVDAATSSGSLPLVTRFALIATPALALSVGALGAVLASWRADARTTRVSVGLGVLLIATAALPVTLGRSLSADPTSYSALAFIAGWGLLVVAAQTRRAHDARDLSADRAGLQLRHLMAPTVAMVMGAVAIDAVMRPSARETTALALGLLGAMLALRTAQLLRSTHRLPAQRRQLAQTRALVDLSRALAGTTDLDETLALMTRWTCHLLNAHAAGVELLDEEGAALEYRAAYGMPASVLGARVPLEASFSGLVMQEGRPRATSSPEHTRTGASMHKAGRSSLAAAPLRYRTRLLGALSCVATHDFSAEDLALLGALADQAAVAIENARLFQQVRVLSLTDPLTGLANRRHLERELGREFAAARRGRRVVGVMFDLDGFKQYNDAHGHVAGDAALRGFARALAGETRAMNLAARFGGDEFFVLLADANEAGAKIFVQRVRERFAEEVNKLGRGPLEVSAGIAEYRPAMPSQESLVDDADRALYASKGQRRRAPHTPVGDV